MEKDAEGEECSTVRILFFGTSEFAVEPLNLLSQYGFDIAGVVSTPDKKGKRGKKLIEPPVKVAAKKLSLEVYQPEKLKTDEAFKKIESFKADIFVVVSYGKFLPDSILSIPRLKAVNIHPSLLPKYRGPSPINYALLNGDKYTGVSIIDVSSEMDAGDIYMQWVEKINENDNYETLHNRLSKIGSNMVACVLNALEGGEVKPKKQDNKKATYSKIIKKEDGKIDFKKMDAETIVNMVKAYYEWPSAYFYHKGKMFKIYEAKKIDEDAEASTVSKLTKKELVIGCAKGSLSVKKIQPESKKPMDIKAFLAGYRFEIGETIG